MEVAMTMVYVQGVDTQDWEVAKIHEDWEEAVILLEEKDDNEKDNWDSLVVGINVLNKDLNHW